MPMPSAANALTRALLRLSFVESPLISTNVFEPQHANAYDLGQYGEVPSQVFNSSDIIAPKVLQRTWDASICEADQDMYYFLAPYGYADYFSGPMILDYRGELVWRDPDHPQSYGLDVQMYYGEPHLTWWTGDDSIRGHGVGSYYMLDNSYRLRHKQGPFNNMPADLHEFHLTPDNTAISTSFPSTPFDLRPYGGSADGYVWDGVFQEYDMETNQLLFEWRATDHFTPHDCEPLDDPVGLLYDPKGSLEKPWDYYHINSVDKDPKGNYLVSGRYCGISYISGQTGEVLWQLGGLNNTFEDLSDQRATSFAYQHHARWADDYSAITLLDNHASTPWTMTSPTRALKVKVDQGRMRASVLNELIHPDGHIAISQGSMQSLPNGNFLVGYGHTAVATEFTPAGQVACDLQFAPLHAAYGNEYKAGAEQSYRVFKHHWVGQPWYDPEVKFGEPSGLYVSWNGATEVRSWRLEGSVDRANWQIINEIPKKSFETLLPVEAQYWTIFRLTALDRYGTPIKKWNVFEGGAVQALAPPRHYIRQRFSDYLIIIVGLLAVAAAAIVTLAACWFRRCGRYAGLRLRGGSGSEGILEENYMPDDDFSDDETKFDLESVSSGDEDYQVESGRKKSFAMQRSFA